jgi:hypothetical protein
MDQCDWRRKMRYSILFCLSLLILTARAQVKIENEAFDEGQAAFHVSTPFYSVYLQKEAGGLSSMCDPENNDWIGYRNAGTESYPASAASSYRGIPNLVNGGEGSGTGHPGFYNCHSELSSDSVVTVWSTDGKWKMKYEFHTTHIVLSVTESDPGHPYWFLYEGSPGGVFKPEKTVWGTDRITLSGDIPCYYSGQSLQFSSKYIWFGRTDQKYTFFLAIEGNDDCPELLGFLGNKGCPENSPDGMVVFGFGRGPEAKSFLMGKRKLIFGFVDINVRSTRDTRKVRNRITKIVKYEEKTGD